jgi:hypothetical protein
MDKEQIIENLQKVYELLEDKLDEDCFEAWSIVEGMLVKLREASDEEG